MKFVNKENILRIGLVLSTALSGCGLVKPAEAKPSGALIQPEEPVAGDPPSTNPTIESEAKITAEVTEGIRIKRGESNVPGTWVDSANFELGEIGQSEIIGDSGNLEALALLLKTRLEELEIPEDQINTENALYINVESGEGNVEVISVNMGSSKEGDEFYLWSVWDRESEEAEVLTVLGSNMEDGFSLSYLIANPETGEEVLQEALSVRMGDDGKDNIVRIFNPRAEKGLELSIENAIIKEDRRSYFLGDLTGIFGLVAEAQGPQETVTPLIETTLIATSEPTGAPESTVTPDSVSTPTSQATETSVPTPTAEVNEESEKTENEIEVYYRPLYNQNDQRYWQFSKEILGEDLEWREIDPELVKVYRESMESFDEREYVNPDIPLIGQERNLSCESAVVRMLLASYGFEFPEEEILDKLILSDNPHEGFVGDVDAAAFNGSHDSGGYGTYAEPWPQIIKDLTDDQLTGVVNYNMTYEQLDELVKNGFRVGVWMTKWTDGREDWNLEEDGKVLARFYGHEHISAVAGRDENGDWILNDPWTARKGETFTASVIPNWDLFGNPNKEGADGRMTLIVVPIDRSEELRQILN